MLSKKQLNRQGFHFDTDRELITKKPVKNYLYQLNGSIAGGYPRPLFLLVKFHNDENALAEICLMAMFLSPFIKIELNAPINMFKQIGLEQQNDLRGLSHSQRTINFQLYEAFNGTVGFDKQFTDKITLEIIKLIKTALNRVLPEVRANLERSESYAKGMPSSGVGISQKTLIISNIE